ncbi:hypothetical protein MFUL124B02_31355 [Myxococcus fulvus 124B02]|nr:hypothetical protein MFUL124B02_31355 [Myxococcus fulvus 124B02]
MGCLVLLVATLSCGEPKPVAEPSTSATKTQALATVKVPRTVAAGAYHTLFLEKDGTVWAWGQNVSGQLGTGATSTTVQSQPTRVHGLPAIKALAAGIAHSLALDVTGDVWVWGQNANGQGGLGNTGGTVLVPTRVAALSGIQSIAANGNYSLALGSDGRLWAWGQNNLGQVGTGSTSAAVSTPTQVQPLPTMRAMAAGVNHVLALDADGRVWGWGANSSAQVGTGAVSATVLTPTQAQGFPRASAVAAGAGHSLLVDSQFGNVWAWGQNTFGQVGTGSASTAPVLSPVPVSGVFAVTTVVAGHNSSLIIMSNGLVKTWGHNVFGQLGNGSTTNSAVPVDVTGLSNALGLAAGAQHALALRSGCPVWGWGNNGQGQLGLGNTSTTPTSTPVSSLLTNTFYFDGDMDGFGDEYIAEQACEPSPGFVEELDCDDYTPTTYPGAPELCNGMDDSCDGVVDDGDPSGGEGCATGQLGVCAVGTTACSSGTVVCVQAQGASEERCDTLDNDCDGEADEGNPGGLQTCATGQQGVCGEGVTYCTHGVIDCVQKEPASSETCDGRDNDCNGQSDDGLAFQAWYRDADGDGFGLDSQTVQACAQPHGYVATAGDCDDTQSSRRPGAAEVCDDIDNDCDAQVDEGVPTQAWYRDADGDGFGDASQPVQGCRQPSGYVANASDCNDANGAVRPGATEVCDSVDNDCDGQLDEGTLTTWYRDADADGYGNGSQPTQACARPSGYVSNNGDCNDSDGAIRPGATEVCDGVDNNCSGATDEGVPTQTWYRDADGDGYGTSTTSTQRCSQPSGYVANASDCNDASASVRPGATEVCDSLDNNCNGSVDEGVRTTYYPDADGDGYGGSGTPIQACSQPPNHRTTSSDCNDSNASIHPSATETCDSVDNNCNGSVDENVLLTWYRDADGDGHGTSSQSTTACTQPGGYVASATDCNDSNASIYPGAPEYCDQVDTNCNGHPDDGTITISYPDNDLDGYGDSAWPRQTTTCAWPPGYRLVGGDCNDRDSSMKPGGTEVCDGKDNDCDGQVDEGFSTSTWYRDADGDGYGQGPSIQSCSQPVGYVANNTDCDDETRYAHPGYPEICNDHFDNDCDGRNDEPICQCTARYPLPAVASTPELATMLPPDCNEFPSDF